MKSIREMNEIILASASPRRKELLHQMGLEFKVMPSNLEEVVTRKAPREVVMELSSQKARDIMFKVAFDSISEGNDDILVIGADTVVADGDNILGKPKDIDEAKDMITSLQGHAHSVFTGVTLVYLKEGIAQTKTFYEETRVFVDKMTPEQIDIYLASGEYADKAGAYAIQGLFAEFITRIEGDYNNVVGLPVGRIMRECYFG